MDNVKDVTLDLQGNPVFADLNGNVVVRLNPDGTLSVLAGNGLAGFSGDGGPAVNASLNGPWGVGFDSQGNLYIADAFNNRVRRITPDGIISTFAGGGRGSTIGDGGPATLAKLSQPVALAVDPTGNVYINDQGNKRIRRVTPDGAISTYAGNGISAVTTDASGNVSISCQTGRALESSFGLTYR